MRTTRHFVVVMLIGMASAHRVFAQAPANLGVPYSLRSGDYAALLLSEFFKIGVNSDVPKIVTYEPSENTIDVELFGTANTVEGAREAVNTTWSFISALYLPYVERRMHIRPVQSNFRITYYDRTAAGGPKLILQWVRGQLVLPS